EIGNVRVIDERVDELDDRHLAVRIEFVLTRAEPRASQDVLDLPGSLPVERPPRHCSRSDPRDLWPSRQQVFTGGPEGQRRGPRQNPAADVWIAPSADYQIPHQICDRARTIRAANRPRDSP